ncbi:MAG: transglutaminase domain-containing protein [Candidatus Izemoplasmataceae bacterium]
MSKTYLEETNLVNFNHESIQNLIHSSNWNGFNTYDKIDAIHHFVRDEIEFGYNHKDAMKASDVLAKRYGQCNTKSILLMALLRAVNIPCKIEAFYVKSDFQMELFPKLIRPLAPKRFLHTRVLVDYKNQWIPLEGFILDKPYIKSIQQMHITHQGKFYGYAIATPDLFNLSIDWQGKETKIQKDAITENLGIFDDPDRLFDHLQQKLSIPKMIIYRYIIRHMLNRRVKKIRK